MKPILNSMLAVWLLASPMPLLAHEGSHAWPANPRTWRYADRQVAAEGSFLLVKNGCVQIQNTQGRVVSILLTRLSWMDGNYVERAIARIEQLNAPPPEQELVQAGFIRLSQTEVVAMMLALALVVLGLPAAGFRLPFARQRLVLAGCLGFVGLMLACKKEADPGTTVTTTTPKNDPTVVDAAFAAYKMLVRTRWDGTYFYVESAGIPAHNMMIGITNWQQQVPIPQPYSGTNAWSIPLAPQLATSPLSTKTNFMKGAIALAVNGIPIFNPLNNRGEDSYLIGELDQWGGHCGKADDYHYHIPPLHLQTTSGNLPIAYALDGYAVYGTNEPDGTAMQTLDAYHGHAGSNGLYHYHATTTYPYMIGSMRGMVALDPATTAPENQISPQAASKPIRPAGTPLNGAKIIAFSAPATNAYSLEYQVNAKSGYINYSWTATAYTFVFTNPSGAKTTATYPR